MIIRSAQANDAASIKELLIQLGYDGLTLRDVTEKMKLHTQPDYKVLVAEEDSLVIGFIALHWFEVMHHQRRLGRITAFCVDQKYRSKQVGRKMLAAAEEVFRNNECDRVEVTSNNRRTGAHRFYLNLGYDEPSRRFAKELWKVLQ